MLEIERQRSGSSSSKAPEVEPHLTISEEDANKLVSMGVVERWTVEESDEPDTLHVLPSSSSNATPIGRGPDLTAQIIAHEVCMRRGFGFYMTPDEGGQDAYDISMEAIADVEYIAKRLSELASPPVTAQDPVAWRYRFYERHDGDEMLPTHWTHTGDKAQVERVWTRYGKKERVDIEPLYASPHPVSAEPVGELYFTDSTLPVMAMSGDHEDPKTLKLHFRRPVTNKDRDDMIAAMNAHLVVSAERKEAEDAARLNYLEEGAKRSMTGVTIDFVPFRFDEEPHGFRLMRRHEISGTFPSLRAAIDAAAALRGEQK